MTKIIDISNTSIAENVDKQILKQVTTKLKSKVESFFEDEVSINHGLQADVIRQRFYQDLSFIDKIAIQWGQLQWWNKGLFISAVVAVLMGVGLVLGGLLWAILGISLFISGIVCMSSHYNKLKQRCDTLVLDIENSEQQLDDLIQDTKDLEVNLGVVINEQLLVNDAVNKDVEALDDVTETMDGESIKLVVVAAQAEACHARIEISSAAIEKVAQDLTQGVGQYNEHIKSDTDKLKELTQSLVKTVDEVSQSLTILHLVEDVLTEGLAAGFKSEESAVVRRCDEALAESAKVLAAIEEDELLSATFVASHEHKNVYRFFFREVVEGDGAVLGPKL